MSSRRQAGGRAAVGPGGVPLCTPRTHDAAQPLLVLMGPALGSAAPRAAKPLALRADDDCAARVASGGAQEGEGAGDWQELMASARNSLARLLTPDPDQP